VFHSGYMSTRTPVIYMSFSAPFSDFYSFFLMLNQISETKFNLFQKIYLVFPPTVKYYRPYNFNLKCDPSRFLLEITVNGGK
jgi:hypothetical protein